MNLYGLQIVDLVDTLDGFAGVPSGIKFSDDGDADMLIGGGGEDIFYAGTTDIIENFNLTQDHLRIVSTLGGFDTIPDFDFFGQSGDVQVTIIGYGGEEPFDDSLIKSFFVLDGDYEIFKFDEDELMMLDLSVDENQISVVSATVGSLIVTFEVSGADVIMKIGYVTRSIGLQISEPEYEITFKNANADIMDLVPTDDFPFFVHGYSLPNPSFWPCCLTGLFYIYRYIYR